MYPQNAYNLISEIADDKLAELENILKEIQKDVEDNLYFSFSKIQTIHFARFVILDAVKDSTGKIIYPAYLAFESNYDGALDNHLTDIVKNTKDNNGFDGIFCACKSFPTKVTLTDKDRINFLKTDSQYHPYFYRGTWGRTVLQIKAEQQTRTEIQDYLNKTPQLRTKSDKEIYNQIKQNVTLSTSSTQYPPTPSSLSWVFIFIIPIALGLLYGILYPPYYLVSFITGWHVKVMLPLVLHFLIISVTLLVIIIAFILYKLLRHKEETDEELDKSYDPNPETGTLKTLEDRIVQNQLTHLVELKDGSFRFLLLKMVLFLVEMLGIYKFNKGELGGIPSIHFARWIIIDRGKRVLFYSNFDGSWENYLGDFIDRAAVGLTAVWSNTKLFPKAKNLFQEGATDEQKFKSWTRMHQITTQVWYSAYKNLTVENVNNNTAIQEGLKKATPMTDKELKDWLLKL